MEHDKQREKPVPVPFCPSPHMEQPGIELMPTQWQATAWPGTVYEKNNIYNWQPVTSEKQLIDTSRFLDTARSYQYLTFSCIVTPQVLEKNYTRSMLANKVSP